MKTSQSQKITLVAAWTVMLLASLLPTVVLQELFGNTVTADMQAIMSISMILIALLASFIWKPLRGLRPLFILLFVLIGGKWLVYTRIDELPFYRVWLRNPSFNVYMLAEQSLNLVVTLLMIAALLLMEKKGQDFYLARGDIAAPAQAIPWLGIKTGDRWSRIGPWASLFISLGTLAFLIIAGRPSLDLVIRVLPYLPAVLLAAALNSFTEEMTYKASFLSVLESPLGPRQAVCLVAVYFGVMHYYGVPYGVVGVLLATFLGWFLARSMQDTRGMFWAWFIHFWQDVWIFSFLALAAITTGGG